jgi:hypothetical protein
METQVLSVSQETLQYYLDKVQLNMPYVPPNEIFNNSPSLYAPRITCTSYFPLGLPTITGEALLDFRLASTAV